MAAPPAAAENGGDMLPETVPVEQSGGLRSPRLPAIMITVALLVFIGGGFSVIVWGGSMLLGEDEPPAWLTLGATVAVVFTFEPTKRALRSFGNRLVYGHRSTPWQAVRRLSAQLGESGDATDSLTSVCAAIASASGASRVAVWIDVEGVRTRLSAHPDDAAGAVTADAEPPVDEPELVFPVVQGGDTVGAITLTGPGAASLTPTEQALVENLAASTAIVLRNVLLRTTLEHRLTTARRTGAELAESRSRIVATHDEARRRAERDLHDTCQQRAVLAAGRLGLAGVYLVRDPGRATAAIDDCIADLGRLAVALDRVVDSGGPAELDEVGVAAALRIETAGGPIPVVVDDHTRGRYPRRVEETLFLVCMEATQNAVKHAKATVIRVRLEERPGSVRVSVEDDGAGFDDARPSPGSGLRNMRERLLAVDGRLAVRTSPAGTTVEAEIPADRLGAP